MRSVSGERGAPAAQCGSVTAELAIGMLGVVLALAAVLSVSVAAQAQMSVQNAAAAGARAAARGDPAGRVSAVARAHAGEGSEVSVGSGGEGLVQVSVQRRVELSLPGTPSVVVTGRASALVEGSTS